MRRSGRRRAERSIRVSATRRWGGQSGPTRAPLLLGLFILVLLAASCADDPGTEPDPHYQIGVLEGFVWSASVGAVARVGVKPLDFRNNTTVVFEAASDSSGWYRLELATGAYEIGLNLRNGIGSIPPANDTVHVAAKTRRYDFERGRIEVRLTVPPSFEGRSFASVTDVGFGELRTSVRTTAHDGRLDFVHPIVKAGPHRVGIEQGGSTLWLPGSFASANAAVLDVVTDRATVYEDTLAYASITGRVTGAWQEALASLLGGFEIQAFTADSIMIGKTRVQDDGTYLLEIFDAQPVKLRSLHSRFARWFGAESFAEATLFDLHPGDALTDVSMIDSGIACKLEGPGWPVRYRTQLRVRDERGRVTESPHSGEEIVVVNLASGRYFLEVEPSDCEVEVWAGQWFDGTESIEEATPIDLAEGELRRITLRLEEGGVIEGQVLAADGTPVERVYVQIADRDKLRLCSRWFSWSQGAFEFTGLRNGEYYLYVDVLPGSADLWWYPGTAAADSAQAIRIEDHGVVTGLDWRLPPVDAREQFGLEGGRR